MHEWERHWFQVCWFILSQEQKIWRSWPAKLNSQPSSYWFDNMLEYLVAMGRSHPKTAQSALMVTGLLQATHLHYAEALLLLCLFPTSPLPHPFLMPAPHKQGPIPLKPSPQTCAFPPPSSPHVCLLSPIGGYSRFLLTVFSRYKETWKCCTVYSREKGMLYINL